MSGDAGEIKAAAQTKRGPRQAKARAAAPPEATAPPPLDPARRPVDQDSAGPHLNGAQAIALIRRHWLPLAAITLLAMAFTYQSMRVRPPVFQAVAEVVVGGQTETAAEILELLKTFQLGSAMRQTTTDMLSSRANLAAVVDALDLTDDPDFNASLREPSWFSLSGLGQRLGVGLGLTAPPAPVPAATQREMAVTALSRAVDVEQDIWSPALTLKIRARARDRNLAAGIANALVDAYLRDDARARAADLAAALTVLRERAQTMRSQIEAQEARLAAHLRDTRLTAGAGATTLRAQIAYLQAQRAIAKEQGDQAQGAEFGAQITTLEAALAARMAADVRRSFLERELETDKDRFDGVVARIAELELSGDVFTAMQTPLTRATPPLGPIPKRAMRSAVLGGFGALMLALIGLFVITGSNNRIRDPSRIEQILGVRCLAITPEMPGGAGRRRLSGLHESLRQQSRSPFAEAIRRIAIQFAGRFANAGPTVIAVTSSMPGEGKSAISLSLSLATRASFRRIAVVDLDLRRAGLTDQVSAGADDGPRLKDRNLRAWLEGAVGIARVPSGFRSAPGVDVLPTLLDPQNPAPELIREHLDELFGFLRDNYDLVIIDTPPLLLISDFELVAPHADGVLFVVGWEMVNEAALATAAKMLQRVRTPVLGAILNRVNLKRAGASQAIAVRTRAARAARA